MHDPPRTPKSTPHQVVAEVGKPSHAFTSARAGTMRNVDEQAALSACSPKAPELFRDEQGRLKIAGRPPREPGQEQKKPKR